MDNWLALFDGQPRYLLEINDSAVKPDVLNFTGREALSEPFSWDKAMTGGGICLSCLMKAAMNGDTFVIRGES